MLVYRITTAFFLLVFTLAVSLFHNALYLPWLILVFHILILWEWIGLHKENLFIKIFICLLLIFSFIYFKNFNNENFFYEYLIFFAILFWLILSPLFVLKQLVPLKFVGIFIAFCCCLASLLSLNVILEQGLLFFLSVLCIAWIADTAAYIFGSLFGKKKLAVSISPNKTWEGVFGALIISLLMTLVFILLDFGWYSLINELYGLSFLIMLNFLVTIVSVYADLFQSLLKRNCGVKDSGKILPGHGGAFDRFDALISTTPIIALLI